MDAADQNKQILRALLREVDSRDLGQLEDYYHSDYTEHGGSSKSPGVAGLRPGLTAFLAAFDDIHHTVDDVVAEGDRLAARITFSGVFARPLFGRAPSGRRVTATSIALYRFRDGKIAEKWSCFDTLAHLDALAKP